MFLNLNLKKYDVIFLAGVLVHLYIKFPLKHCLCLMMGFLTWFRKQKDKSKFIF